MPGWGWCPKCNGEGFVSVMQGDPDLTEYNYECTFCDEGLVFDGK